MIGAMCLLKVKLPLGRGTYTSPFSFEHPATKSALRSQTAALISGLECNSRLHAFHSLAPASPARSLPARLANRASCVRDAPSRNPHTNRRSFPDNPAAHSEETPPPPASPSRPLVVPASGRHRATHD